jgi:hypothetical protein
MIRVVTITIAAVVVAAVAGCGFECNVQGEKEQFASCDDLQSRFTTEADAPTPNNAVLDDLDTCGDVNGCDLKR